MEEIEELFGEPSDSIMQLAKRFGFDPRVDFKFMDLPNTNFENEDLRGVDFTGANLENANFSGATYDSSTIWDGANLIGAKFDEPSSSKRISPDASEIEKKLWVATKHYRKSYREAELMLLARDRPEDPRVSAAHTKYAIDHPNSQIARKKLSNLSPDSLEFRDIWIARLMSVSGKPERNEDYGRKSGVPKEVLKSVFVISTFEEHGIDAFDKFLIFGANLGNLTFAFRKADENRELKRHFLGLIPEIVLKSRRDSRRQIAKAISSGLLKGGKKDICDLFILLLEEGWPEKNKIVPMLDLLTLEELSLERIEREFGTDLVASTKVRILDRQSGKPNVPLLKKVYAEISSNPLLLAQSVDIIWIVVSRNSNARRLITKEMLREFVKSGGTKKITSPTLGDKYNSLPKFGTSTVPPFREIEAEIRKVSSETFGFFEG